MAGFRYDPLAYVMWAFPWGEAAYELRNDHGPEPWQREFLEHLGAEARARQFNGRDPVAPIRIATASGHGIGKSALTSWVILWIMSTRPKCKITVSAMTLPQLEKKTWEQLSKWHRLCLNRDWFSYSNSRGNLSLKAKGDEIEWFTAGLTCKEENSEAFQGQHAPTSSSVYIFDEASGIPDKIWEAAEGGLTDGEPMFIVFGNPTRNVGAFSECFGRQRHRWKLNQIDARNVSRGNKQLFQEWIDDYGEDSDFVRVRVRGVFPRSGSTQFISNEVVSEAMACKLRESEYSFAPKVMGIDVAREGDDFSAIAKRQGLKLHSVKRYSESDTMRFVSIIAREIKEFEPDAVFIDAIGVGVGVIDRLRQIGFQVIEVKGSTKAWKPGYFNLRAQMWGMMRDWLKAGASIPDDSQLEREFTSQEYGFSANDLIQLVGKKEMKALGLASPDTADAVSFTFAQEVHREDPLANFKRVCEDNQEWCFDIARKGGLFGRK